MTRQEANLLILRKLQQYINDYSDIRFGQALRNLGAVREHRDEHGIPVFWENGFMEEPAVTWARMNGGETPRKS